MKNEIEKQIVNGLKNFEVNIHGCNSRYIEVENSDYDRRTIRVSDHTARNGSGFNMNSGEQHSTPDYNIVIEHCQSNGKIYVHIDNKTVGIDNNLTIDQAIEKLISDVKDDLQN